MLFGDCVDCFGNFSPGELSVLALLQHLHDGLDGGCLQWHFMNFTLVDDVVLHVLCSLLQLLLLSLTVSENGHCFVVLIFESLMKSFARDQAGVVGVSLGKDVLHERLSLGQVKEDLLFFGCLLDGNSNFVLWQETFVALLEHVHNSGDHCLILWKFNHLTVFNDVSLEVGSSRFDEFG